MPSSPTLSILIVNWNAGEHLRSCLRSIAAATAGLEHEVIVVDNDSHDGSPAVVTEEIAGARLIESGRNLGFGRGLELAREHASGRYLAAVNPDVVLAPGSLAGLVSFLEERPAAAVAGPETRQTDGSVQSGAERLPGPWSALFDVPLLGRLYRRGHRRARRAARARRCDWVKGACLVFRASALDEVGGFPTLTFLYGEEILIGDRMRRAGHEVWYVPEVSVSHAKGVSTDQLWSSRETLVERRRARIVVMRAILSLPGSLLWNALAAGGLAAQALLAGRRGPSGGEYPHRRLAALHLAALREQLTGGRREEPR